MEGRRWSDGLHQAVEAKEGVKIEKENQTLATITLAELLPALREAFRHDRYRRNRSRGISLHLQTRCHRHSHAHADGRTDFSDVIYRTLPEKWDAVIEEIKDCHDRGQPTLVWHGIGRELRVDFHAVCRRSRCRTTS